MEVYTQKDLRKGLPAPEECTDVEYKVFEFLESTGADYTWLAHGLKFAVSEYEEVCRALDIKIIRNIFLENKKGQLYLLMIHADKKFVTKDVSHTIGSSSLQFASSEKLIIISRSSARLSFFKLMSAISLSPFLHEKRHFASDQRSTTWP